MKHPFPQWSTLTTSTGRSFHWGLCWEWAGPLKFGLISEGYEGVEELYSVITKAVEQLGSSWHFFQYNTKLLAETNKRVHPYTFLMFTHIGDEVFQVASSRSLRQHTDTRKGIMEVAKGVHQRNALAVVTPERVAFSRRLWQLRAEAQLISRTTAPDVSGVKVISFPQKNISWSETHNLRKVLYNALDKRLGEDEKEEEDTLEKLEGLYSVVRTPLPLILHHTMLPILSQLRVSWKSWRGALPTLLNKWRSRGSLLITPTCVV